MVKKTEVTESRESRLFGVIPMWKSTTKTQRLTDESRTKNILEQKSVIAVEAKSEAELQVTGTKGDVYTKEIIQRILDEGCLDMWPSSKYIDGVPAHTLSVNHLMTTYDLTKGEMPLITLRPIAVRYAIGELLWIYQDQSNNLDLLKEKYGITWWDEWDIGDRTIGAVYGETVRRHNLVQRASG